MDIRSIVTDPYFFINLFKVVLPTTFILHYSSLAYFNGLFGKASQVAPLPNWDGEIESWTLNIISAIAAILAIFGSGLVIWPVAIIIALFLLLFYLWSNLIRLMFHDLPDWLAKLVLACMILATLIITIGSFVLGLLDPIPFDELLIAISVFLFAAFIAAVIGFIFTMLYKLTRRIGEKVEDWFGPWWRGTPVEGAKGKTATGTAGVTNPAGAIGGNLLNPCILPPDSCITIDFDSSPIDDHWGGSDLRILITPATANISVEVSNDQQNWEPCAPDPSGPSVDFDVPWSGSPWRYVKICNLGNVPVRISDVINLD